jgi:hypothetical protein
MAKYLFQAVVKVREEHRSSQPLSIIINKNLVLGRDWKAIQSDIDSGMSRKDIMKKHNINKNILYSGKRDGKLFGL